MSRTICSRTPGGRAMARLVERIFDDYLVSTDPARLDLGVIHGFLRESYWAEGIPRDILELRDPELAVLRRVLSQSADRVRTGRERLRDFRLPCRRFCSRSVAGPGHFQSFDGGDRAPSRPPETAPLAARHQRRPRPLPALRLHRAAVPRAPDGTYRPRRIPAYGANREIARDDRAALPARDLRLVTETHPATAPCASFEARLI